MPVSDRLFQPVGCALGVFTAMSVPWLGLLGVLVLSTDPEFGATPDEQRSAQIAEAVFWIGLAIWLAALIAAIVLLTQPTQIGGSAEVPRRDPESS